MTYDYCIAGGGIVGLSTAMHLLNERSGAGVIVLEKEAEVGQHQTGNNSGVIHSGALLQARFEQSKDLRGRPYANGGVLPGTPHRSRHLRENRGRD